MDEPGQADQMRGAAFDAPPDTAAGTPVHQGADAGARSHPADGFRGHPDFDRILQGFCRRVVAPLQEQRPMIKLFGQRAPTEIAAHIVMMHMTAGTPAARPTLTRLQRRLPAPRQTAAFVALLRGFGLVQVEPDAHDRRLRYLVPGAQMTDGLRTWLAVHLDCCEQLALTRHGWADRIGHDPAFLAALVRHCAAWLDPARRPISRFPDLGWLDERDSGLYLALDLVAAHDRDAPAGWIDIAAPALGRRLGVSKSHVRNLLNAMEARGLLRHDAQRRRVQLEPGFVVAVERWFCRQVAWIGAAAAQAGAAPGPG